MNEKNEIYLKLTTNIIIDYLKNYCKENNKIIFVESDVSSYKSIRFSTNIINHEFKPSKSNVGYYKNGQYIYFEIKPIDKKWCIFLNVSKIDLPVNLYKKLLLLSCKVMDENENYVTLFKRELADLNDDAHTLIASLNDFIDRELEIVQDNIFKNNNNNVMENEIDIYVEGGINPSLVNKYERNREARIRCIEHYGAKCKICGFDFGKTYGEEFKDKIEVHHKVPLHEINKEYIVDPINDLIPVCPNCHMILHSKKEGTYTVEEVRSFLNSDND